MVNALHIGSINLPDDVLTITIPSKLRRRGVEARFMIGAQSCEREDILIANIARADAWRREITAGKTLAEIANAEDRPTTYIAQILDFGFLAPDIVKQCLAGQQPPILTTNWLRRHDLPMDWDDQQRLLADICRSRTG